MMIDFEEIKEAIARLDKFHADENERVLILDLRKVAEWLRELLTMVEDD